jgi:hypothetical protein
MKSRKMAGTHSLHGEVETYILKTLESLLVKMFKKEMRR